MRLPDEPDIPPQINIVPMIDVVFAILTFFMMSSLFLTRSEGLSVNLPSASSGKTQPPASVTVTINSEGELAVNRESIGLEALEGAVQKLRKPDQELLILETTAMTLSRIAVVLLVCLGCKGIDS